MRNSVASMTFPVAILRGPESNASLILLVSLITAANSRGVSRVYPEGQ